LPLIIFTAIGLLFSACIMVLLTKVLFQPSFENYCALLLGLSDPALLQALGVTSDMISLFELQQLNQTLPSCSSELPTMLRIRLEVQKNCQCY
jgi:hypothetical protein